MRGRCDHHRDEVCGPHPHLEERGAHEEHEVQAEEVEAVVAARREVHQREGDQGGDEGQGQEQGQERTHLAVLDLQITKDELRNVGKEI